MIYIGIDFSKNSPGVTLVKNGKFHFFSFARDFAVNSHKKAFAHHVNLETEISDCSIIDYTLLDTNNKNEIYYKNEWNKIHNSMELSTKIVETLSLYISQDEWLNTTIAFEGFSYGSKGNVLIDIVTMTSILKYDLWSKSGSNIYVFAPTQIKSLATGKGTAKKDVMLEFFLKENFDSEFKEYCSKLEIENGKVPKPIEDIVDSYFVVKSLISLLNKEKEEKESSN